MRLLRWFIRIGGIAFMCAVYAACLVGVVYPRWWTAVAVATVAICFSCAGLLLVVASFMPNLDTLKQASALRRQARPAQQTVAVKCAECQLVSAYFCKTHRVRLCESHAVDHVRKHCSVYDALAIESEVSHART